MTCHESMSDRHCRGAAYAEINPMIVHELETLKRSQTAFLSLLRVAETQTACIH